MADDWEMKELHSTIVVSALNKHLPKVFNICAMSKSISFLHLTTDMHQGPFRLALLSVVASVCPMPLG